jgi:hypothetical protein
MDLRESSINAITRRLAYLKSEVELRNSINLYDLNIHAEDFYKELFNLVYDWRLKNLNIQTKNAAFVDLIDPINKKAIQVTSQNDNKKINEAINGFYSNPENNDFNLKVLLISKLAKNYRTDFTAGGQYNFDHKRDIIDMERLLNDIKKLPDIDKINKIVTFLSKEVPLTRLKTESNEVETIMSLIEFLSRDENRVAIQRNNETDPNKKINERFSEHSQFITGQYENLYSIYFGVLAVAKKGVGIDGVKSQIISSYLKDESDEILYKNKNNPRDALREMVDYFEEKLNRNGIIGDKQAIRFYLLDELINCNVFPNP